VTREIVPYTLEASSDQGRCQRITSWSEIGFMSSPANRMVTVYSGSRTNRTSDWTPEKRARRADNGRGKEGNSDGTSKGYHTNNDTKAPSDIPFMPHVIDSFGGAERDRTADLLVAKKLRDEFSTTL
jgi:hypothetical protein